MEKMTLCNSCARETYADRFCVHCGSNPNWQPPQAPPKKAMSLPWFIDIGFSALNTRAIVGTIYTLHLFGFLLAQMMCIALSILNFWAYGSDRGWIAWAGWLLIAGVVDLAFVRLLCEAALIQAETLATLKALAPPKAP